MFPYSARPRKDEVKGKIKGTRDSLLGSASLAHLPLFLLRTLRALHSTHRRSRSRRCLPIFPSDTLLRDLLNLFRRFGCRRRLRRLRRSKDLDVFFFPSSDLQTGLVDLFLHRHSLLGVRRRYPILLRGLGCCKDGRTGGICRGIDEDRGKRRC